MTTHTLSIITGGTSALHLPGWIRHIIWLLYLINDKSNILERSLSDWNCKSHGYTYLINDKVWHIGQIFIWLKLQVTWLHISRQWLGTDLYLTKIANHMTTHISSMIRDRSLSDWNWKSHDYTYLINNKGWHIGQIFIWLKLQITWLHLPHQQWGVTRWTDLYLTKTANHTVTPTSSMMRCDTLDRSLSDWSCRRTTPVVQ